MRTLLLTMAVTALALGHAAAEECVLTSSEPWATAGSHYVAGDPLSIIICNPTCIMDLWIYEESNGVAGLQRADEIHDDTCGGRFVGDTVVL